MKDILFFFTCLNITCFVLSLFLGLGSKGISAIFLDSWVYQKFTTWVIHSILGQTWWTGKECDYPLQNDWLVSNKLISYFLTVDAFETCSHIISYFWFPPCSHYSSYHLHCSDAGRGNCQVFATLNLVNYMYIRSNCIHNHCGTIYFFLLFYNTCIWSSVDIRKFLIVKEKKNRH